MPKALRFLVVGAMFAGCETTPSNDGPPAVISIGRAIEMPIAHESRVATPAAANNLLHYYGGRVIQKPQVVQVLWGTNIAPELVSGIPNFYRGVLQSPYMDWLGEYDTINVAAGVRLGMGTTSETKQKIGRGSFLSTVQITPSNVSTNLADADVMTELAHQIDTGVLPAPLEDGHGGYRTLYMIEFPSGVQITAPGGARSCVEYCAYHSAGVYKGKTLAFGVLPDLTQQGCAGGCGMGASNLANASSVHSHELIEATTDPDLPILLINGGPNPTIDSPVGWFSEGGGGEIGDICNAQQAMVGTFTVQSEWSNSQGQCITNVTGQATCVDNSPGGCTACTTNAQCSGVTPSCASDTTDYKTGECVQCLDATGCSGATPVCDKTPTEAGDKCRGCAASPECAAPTPVCAIAAAGSIAAGTCVECLASTDCALAKPVCDTTAGACMGCTSDAQCTDPMNPSCDTDKGSCGESTGCGCSTRSPSTSSIALFGLLGIILLRRRRR